MGGLPIPVTGCAAGGSTAGRDGILVLSSGVAPGETTRQVGVAGGPDRPMRMLAGGWQPRCDPPASHLPGAPQQGTCVVTRGERWRWTWETGHPSGVDHPGGRRPKEAQTQRCGSVGNHRGSPGCSTVGSGGCGPVDPHAVLVGRCCLTGAAAWGVRTARWLPRWTGTGMHRYVAGGTGLAPSDDLVCLVRGSVGAHERPGVIVI